MGFAERVELELGVDVVTDDVGAAGVAGEYEWPLVEDGLPGGGVGGHELGAVLEQAFGDEAHRVVELSEHLDGATLAALEIAGGKALAFGEFIRCAKDR